MVDQNQDKEKDRVTIKKCLISKCIEDPIFKQNFLSNAKDTVEKEFNIRLPNETQIEALEETETKMYVILPSKQAIESGQAGAEVELNDEELKSISAGLTPGEILDKGLIGLGKGIYDVTYAVGGLLCRAFGIK